MAKTVIVTGASKGIGLAVAKYLVSQTHNVVVLARSDGPLKDLESTHPRQVRTLAGDLSDFTLAPKSVELAVQEFGQLDGLVINHGAMFGVNRISDLDITDWQKMFDVNFFSAVAFTKAALPELRKTNGTIVYTSSGASTGAYSAWGAYVAAKAAINALARQIACEEDQVTAFAIRPGVVDTDMQRDLREIHSAVMDEKDNAKFLGAHENKTLLKPEQPGHIIAKLAIDPARDFNGQYLSWDSKELSKYQDQT